MQLNKMKAFENENVGPGSYGPGGAALQKKTFASPLAAAFGTTDNRKLDTTDRGILSNPGPGSYLTSTRVSNSPLGATESSVFKSSKPRQENLSGNPFSPGPNKYNLADYNSIGKKPLQGGAPNNVLSLQKAETKKVLDTMFPFLVKDRMPDDPKAHEMANVGPGSYSPSNQSLIRANNSSNMISLKKELSSGISRQKNATISYIDSASQKVIQLGGPKDGKASGFGSSSGRFDEMEKLLANAPNKMGPGAYSNI